MLELKTGDKSKIFDSFFANTKKFYLAFLILTLLQTAQATFKSLNCLAQRANSLKEHTSHCCGVQKKKTAYSNRFSPLKHLTQQGQIKEESWLGLSSGQSGQGEAEKQLATRDERPQQKAKVGYITWLHASSKMPTEWDYAHNGHLSNVIQSELLAPTYAHTSAESY